MPRKVIALVLLVAVASVLILGSGIRESYGYPKPFGTPVGGINYPRPFGTPIGGIDKQGHAAPANGTNATPEFCQGIIVLGHDLSCSNLIFG